MSERWLSYPELQAVLGKDKAEVKSGLGDDALVIATPPAGLKEGTRLRATGP